MQTDDPLDPKCPFTRREFRMAGLDERRLRSAEFKTVFYGVHVHAGVPDSILLRARAALRITDPSAHISHVSAALLHDLCPPERAGTDVSTPEGVSRSHVDGINPHQANPAAEVVLRNGIRVSSPVQTFLDLAGMQGTNLVDLVVVGDRLVRKRLVTESGLVAAAEAWPGRGRRRALRAARLVRAGVDSPMESRLRILIVLAGLPEPQVNVILRRRNGEWEIRLDLAYRGQKVIIEYDGRQHTEIKKQWLRDIERREQLDGWGWRIVIVTAEGIFDDPAQTVQRVWAVARQRHVPGVPRRPTDGWRAYFPTRTPR
ncbi:MAG: DUF559 domain-containing protein [Propionibacteriales bacterium]|nr:DUF559 domain-containing protein [Propionibacteriales bacterium]